MPWLAVPFQHVECASRLKLLFQVAAVPRLVVLDGGTRRVLRQNARGDGFFGYGCKPLDVFAHFQAQIQEEHAREAKRSAQNVMQVGDSRDDGGGGGKA